MGFHKVRSSNPSGPPPSCDWDEELSFWNRRENLVRRTRVPHWNVGWGLRVKWTRIQWQQTQEGNIRSSVEKPSMALNTPPIDHGPPPDEASFVALTWRSVETRAQHGRTEGGLFFGSRDGTGTKWTTPSTKLVPAPTPSWSKLGPTVGTNEATWCVKSWQKSTLEMKMWSTSWMFRLVKAN